MTSSSPTVVHEPITAAEPKQLYEYDREPVPHDKLFDWVYFAGLYAGEHTAATEFVIGALFVSWGATAIDILFGLLIGNVLAVLSWTLFCTPIAVDTRLTIYWYINRIGGPSLAFFYNALNGILFCILAGTMLTVSASAIRLLFPTIAAQTLWYPTDYRFVLIVILVGAMSVLLAILGLRKLSEFATICAPWMILMFVAGGLAALPLLGDASGVGPIRSFPQFWTMAKHVVWTGTVSDYQTRLGFWHIVCFAWICNLGMHIGLSDMATFRYARRARYGLCTSTGMFLGHYVAWICAGLMGAAAALLLKTPLAQLDSGAIGFSMLGSAGALAVLLSGWTTAMPTLYKAGLAFQAVTPDWPRGKVTAIAGAVTTTIACFPFVFAEMLNFVGLYGLLLLPIGAIVFAEHWVFPKVGLERFWIYRRQRHVNWPAFVTWFVAIGMSMFLWQVANLHLFFLFLPCYFVSLGLYVALAWLAGAREGAVTKDQAEVRVAQAYSKKPTEVHSKVGSTSNPVVLKLTGLIALLSLIGCMALPLWVAASNEEIHLQRLEFMKNTLIVPTLLYFLTGIIWLVAKKKSNGDGV